MRKKKERRKDEEKIYEHLSDFGITLSGLWVDCGDCRLRRNKIFYCMDWHCSDPLCTGRIASYGNVGQNTADDQMDILNNALAYVQTRPVYKSKYYETGYPDDRYGVCTDVVGYAFRKSGYDLRELVDEDIRKNPEDYDVDKPDKNIDFRRVKNLKIYFEHTAISLTTDVNDIEQWQGGDIVVFKNHIGVISDRRNVEGVPYVIHHNDPYQKNYEEDILQSRKDIVGHFRIS